MEYLMTYGWAILVVMVVGIVMWQLGIFNLGGITSTTSTGFPRIKPQLALMSVNTSDHIKMSFTNGAGGPIYLNSVTCEGVGLSGISVGPYSPGENFHLETDATGACADAISGSAGDPYDLTITISYNVTLAGRTVEHLDEGTLRGPLE
jgi:hypothetical protein